MKLAVIIIDFGDLPRTFKYIDDFLKNTRDEKSSDISFVIVENKVSYDGISILENYTNKVKHINIVGCNAILFKMYERECIYVISKENSGFARGNNLGAKIADQLFDIDYYCFSNNDINFQQKYSLSRVQEIFMNNSSVAVVGPKVVGMDGKKQSPCKRKSVFSLLFLWYYNILLNNCLVKLCGHVDNINESKECYWVSGCFMIIDKKKFNEISGFDPNTFLYGEEMILSERLLQKNYIMYFDMENSICHETSQSVNSSFKIIQSIRFDFLSKYYYCKTYRKTSSIILGLAKINFALFWVLFKVECFLIKIKNFRR